MAYSRFSSDRKFDYIIYSIGVGIFCVSIIILTLTILNRRCAVGFIDNLPNSVVLKEGIFSETIRFDIYDQNEENKLGEFRQKGFTKRTIVELRNLDDQCNITSKHTFFGREYDIFGNDDREKTLYTVTYDLNENLLTYYISYAIEDHIMGQTYKIDKTQLYSELFEIKDENENILATLQAPPFQINRRRWDITTVGNIDTRLPPMIASTLSIHRSEEN